MLYVEAVKQGYFKNKIREVGEKFGIPSVQQFSRGVKARKGYDAMGWMKLISISKDHEEDTPALKEELNNIIKAQKVLAKKESDNSEEVDEDLVVDLGSIDVNDTSEADAEQARIEKEEAAKAEAEAEKAAKETAAREAKEEEARIQAEADTAGEEESEDSEEEGKDDETI